jgi:hypothetical protein
MINPKLIMHLGGSCTDRFLVVLGIQGAVGLTGSVLSRFLPQHGRA